MPINHTLKEIELENGAKGLFVQVPGIPVVTYGIHFRAGADKATRAYPFQVAHTLEHVIEAGPDDEEFPTKGSYLQEIQKNGAYRNAGTGQFGITYLGDSITEEYVRILELRKRAIERPKLKSDIRESETGNVLEEMRQRVADYTRLAAALNYKCLTDGNWQTSREAIQEAESVGLKDITKYYEATHGTQNLRFIIIGDVVGDEEEIRRLLSGFQLPEGIRLSGPATTPAAVDTYIYEQRESLENIFTCFTMAIPRQLSPKEKAVMQIINYLLCNTWDSRILGKARDAGLCYSMRGSVDLIQTQTVWLFETPIGANNSKAFFRLMTEALTELKDGKVTSIEIEKAIAYLTGKLKKDGQTAWQLFDMYAEEFFGLDRVTHTDDQLEYLRSVEAHDITALVGEFVASKSRVFSGVGSVTEQEFASQHETLLADLSI